MSHPARLSLRAPPHLPFVQGWPGIPASPNRKGAGVHGTVEVRTGAQAIKAKWVRAEIRKYESAPPSFPSSTETWEHVGEISTLWAAPAGKEWDDLEQADFKFYIPLPDNLPPSVELQKNTGVRYELVAALCYRQKGGVFKKESAPILKISEPIRITKHDIHSAWPVFNIPDTRQVQSTNGELTLIVQRPNSAFGPGDRMLFTATMRSARPKPFKLKGFECNLVETITLTPIPETMGKSKKGKGPAQPITRTRIVASARQVVDESIGRGGDKSARMDLAVPADKLLVTLVHARSLGIRYDLEVKAVCDSGIPDLGIGRIGYTVGPYARSHAQQAVRDIGHVDPLCPGAAPSAGRGPQPPMLLSNPSSRPESFGSISYGPSNPGSSHTLPYPAHTLSPQPPFPPNGFYAQGSPRLNNQPIQGFVPRQDFRRKSSGTSTMTTTTTTTFEQNGVQGQSRPQSMQLRTGAVQFPSASPAPGLQRSTTGRTADSGYTTPSSPIENVDDRARFAKSDLGHGESDSKRFSAGTAATFGRWDRDLRTAIGRGEGPSPITPLSTRPSSMIIGTSAGPGSSAGVSRPPPSAWMSAEQEKSRLYDEARSRAVAAQQSNGASLHTIGLDEPAAPPPEYTPPRPTLPAEQYPSSETINARSQTPVAGGSSGSRLRGVADGSQPSHPSTPASASRSMDATFVSAAEEKEQQRKRFEEAQKRVASGSSIIPKVAEDAGPANDEPIPYDQIFPSSSVAASIQPGKGYMSATEEKEQQRIRFEHAQRRVASGSSIPPRMAEDAGPVNGSTYDSNSVVVPSSPSQMVGSSSRKQTNMGLSEKEQMRRFYEAQDRVAAASGSPMGSPNLVSQGFDPSSAPTSAPGSSIGHSGFSGNVSSGGPSEKEQMRRYYEAQDKVAQTASGASGSGSASQTVPPMSPPPTMKRNEPAGWDITSRMPAPSALNEKEQMKRFYEAQDRVARAANGGTSHAADTDNAPAYDAPSLPGSPAASSAGGNTGGQGYPGHLSAEEEKEAMRKRFENAQTAVERHKRTPSSPRAGSSQPLDNPPRDPIQPGNIRGGFGPSGRNGYSGYSGQSSSQSAPSGPPPPLPTKPPKEYIDLLSPVSENGPSFARFGGMGGSSTIGSGSGSGSRGTGQ